MKRIRNAEESGGMTGELFLSAWAALIQGDDLDRLARRESAHAVVSARLGRIDARAMRNGGMNDEATGQTFQRALDAHVNSLSDLQYWMIQHTLPELLEEPERQHDLLLQSLYELADQPRAGATRPGKPRLIIEPAETHGDHCYMVAVYGALLAPLFDADPAIPFLLGTSHHLHNAYLPDSGFNGEMLLGEHLQLVIDTYTQSVLNELPSSLAEQIRDARTLLNHADSPEAKAFHAADVIDRVLQMVQYEQAANFHVEQALVDLDLVHPGPIQSFHIDIL